MKSYFKYTNRMIFLIIFATTMLFSASTLTLTEKEKAFLSQHPVITVDNEMNYPPYNFNDNGDPKGFSIDYMNLLAEKIGIKVNYVSHHEWNEFMQLIQNDALDVMLNIRRTPEREKHLHFTEPYTATKKAIFSKSISYQKLLDLNEKVACVPKGFYIEHFLEAYYPKITLLRKKTILDCMESVANGMSDAMVESAAIISYLMNKHQISLAYKNMISDKRLTVELSIATAPKLEILKNILQKAMYHVSEEDLSQLSEKWIAPTIQKQTEGMSDTHAVQPFEEKRIITMCNNPNWAPIEFAKEGDMSDIQGIAMDTLKVLEKMLNIEFRTIPTGSWIESQAYLRDGKCDILPAAVITEERQKYANFTIPYLNYRLAIITKNDKPFVNSLADITDKVIARKRGSGLIEKLRAAYPDIKVLQTDGYLESLQKVAKGEAYCTVATLPVASYFINRFSLQNLHIAGYTEMRYKLSMAVNKEHTELVDILNRALSNITQEEHRRIYSKWVNTRLVETFDYRYLLYPFIFAFLVLFLLVYRQRILKGANKNLQKEIEKQTNANLVQHQFIQEQAKLAALGEMIGVIAHQWRQPLNALGLSIQNLRYIHKDGTIDDDFIEGYIDKNLGTIKFMSQTIDDFRNFFRVDKVNESFSVREAIESTLSMQSIYLGKYDITYEVHGDDFHVYGLRSEFQQVILNLIGNAKDALVNHQGTVKMIQIYIEDKTIVFMDNANGIPEEIIDRVFEPYFTTKSKEAGTGIGLYMSKMIIEDKMKGSIRVYNKGDGAVFVLDFGALK